MVCCVCVVWIVFLSIIANPLGDGGVSDIASALSSNTTLQRLSLRSMWSVLFRLCLFQTLVMCVISSSCFWLVVVSHAVRLRASAARLGYVKRCAAALGAMLRDNSTLVELDLAGMHACVRLCVSPKRFLFRLDSHPV